MSGVNSHAIISPGVEVAHIATILGYRGTVLMYNSSSLVDIEQVQDMLHTLEVSSILITLELYIRDYSIIPP